LAPSCGPQGAGRQTRLGNYTTDAIDLPHYSDGRSLMPGVTSIIMVKPSAASL